MPPTLSIATPIYNAETFLARTVESVLAQTFTDFEYLLIDDGSSDASADVAEDYARKDSRIRVIRQENRGIARSRNRALAEAAAPLVAFLDHDDIALPERMRKQVALLKEMPHVLGVGCLLRLLGPGGVLIKELSDRPCRPEEVRPFALRGSCPIPTTALMVRKEAALAAGGLNPAFEPADDYEFLLRLLRAGELALVPEILLDYSFSPGNTSHSQAVAMLRCTKIAAHHAQKGIFFLPTGTEGRRDAATSAMLHSAAQGREASFWKEYFSSAMRQDEVMNDVDKRNEALLAVEHMARYGVRNRRRCASRVLRELPASTLGMRLRAAIKIFLAGKPR